MNVLVTGGAGFIGAHFIKEILDNEKINKVVNLDCLRYGNNLFSLEKIKEDKRYTFIEGNILDSPLLDTIFKTYEISHVVHFAAETHVDKSLIAIDAFLETNILGTKNVLAAASNAWMLSEDKDSCIYRAGVKFLHISTDEVYGPSVSEKMRCDEDASLKPTNPYAASKASADLIARSYHKTFNLPLNITRSVNNYGRFQFPDKLIPLMIVKGLSGEGLPVYGNGMAVREWLHVEDHVQGLIKVLFEGSNGEIYNIGSGCRKRNIEVVETIANGLNLPKSQIVFVEDRLGHDLAYSIDDLKIRKELSFKNEKQFEPSLEALINWYRDNEKWWSYFIK